MYTYDKLPDDNSIRLLQLLPGQAKSPLKAQFTVSQLGTLDSYEALSYVWGEPDVSEALLVHNQELGISRNLHATIERLRYPDRTRTLWIDAICIDQQNDVEKNVQVALMGQIYRQADTVLCWLGEATTQQVLALAYLKQLARDAGKYIKLDAVEHMWTIFADVLVPEADTKTLLESADAARIESVYDNVWFTRLWIAQEVSLAKSPVLIFGGSDVPWKELELATRVLACCLRQTLPHSKRLWPINRAWSLVVVRAQYAINTRSNISKPVVFQLDQQWSLGNVAWNMKDKNCRDDKDRVYALLSLVAAGNSLKMYTPRPFVPDYRRSVEWAYKEFWMRFGGYSSLFCAGLSRRVSYDANTQQIKDTSSWFDEEHLPSWCPDLRAKFDRWKPIFTSDYAASTPMHHMASHLNQATGAGPLMIRGHRIDTVLMGLHLARPITPSEKLPDLVDLRDIVKLCLLLGSSYGSRPSGHAWIDALGSALTTTMPSGPHESDHPFQRYLDRNNLSIRLDDDKLKSIWQHYIVEFLENTGNVWTTLMSKLMPYLRKEFGHNVRFRFDPRTELTHDGLVTWLLHEYIGDVLQMHRFIFTKTGYMGLAPPDTAAGDVVVVLGGPGTAFIIRDTSLMAFSELAVGKYPQPYGATTEKHAEVVESRVGMLFSYLLGPCYLDGVMNGELFKGGRHSEVLEWETDKLGTIPKSTICLI